MTEQLTPSSVSLERLVPGTLSDNDATGKETLDLHMARYHFAKQFIEGGRVLDCACGVGYGTQILANADNRPAYILGVDIDPAAVSYANSHYTAKDMEFLCKDGSKLRDEAGFDLIVSLETIEHVPDPQTLVGNFADLLRPGGKLVASVPVTPSVDVNPYHLHDFTARSFRALGASFGLVEIDNLPQVQKFSALKIISGNEARLDDMRKNMAHYYLTHPGALLKRAKSTVFDGFCNKYLTVVWTKSA